MYFILSFLFLTQAVETQESALSQTLCYKIVFTSQKPSLVMTFDRSIGVHSVLGIEKSERRGLNLLQLISNKTLLRVQYLFLFFFLTLLSCSHISWQEVAENTLNLVTYSIYAACFWYESIVDLKRSYIFIKSVIINL